ncbi:class I SAM-dependent methyltransferase [Paenibacillus solisilvae]|uniref:Class I SAM-dependent methyltransferase n=1 Tax=Paenibacillus solisilvae TaxID=2486751 RepID=A0ABW0VW50_9BACL
MNEKDYKAFYDRAGKLNGWDFSKVRCQVEGEAADLYREVRQACRPSDFLLDIGTGGGEALLQLRDAAQLLVGIDASAGMIRTAAVNRDRLQADNVRFIQMDAGQIDFPEQFFQIISCRHAPFHAQQAAKVLAANGIFLTQQVTEGDKQNLKQAFGRGQGYCQLAGTLQERMIRELTAAGFKEIAVHHVETAEYYRAAEDLIFLLKHAPIIPGFGEDPADYAVLHRFIEENQSEHGIRTNASRLIVTARKS